MICTQMSMGNEVAAERGSSELTGRHLASSLSFYWRKQLILQCLNTVISPRPRADLAPSSDPLPICEDESCRVCEEAHIHM